MVSDGLGRVPKEGQTRRGASLPRRVQSSLEKVKFAGVPRQELVAGKQKASVQATGELHRTQRREMAPEQTGSLWVPMPAGGLGS